MEKLTPEISDRIASYMPVNPTFGLFTVNRRFRWAYYKMKRELARLWVRMAIDQLRNIIAARGVVLLLCDLLDVL